MRILKVIRSGLFYNGRIYKQGESLEVGEDAHVLILTAGGGAEEVLSKVAPAAPDHATYATTDLAAPKRKYVRRDLTA